MFIRKFGILALIGVLAGASSAAQAAIIDNFSSTDDGPLTIAHNSGTTFASLQSVAPEAIGSFRDIRIDTPFHPNTSNQSSSLAAGPSFGGLFVNNSLGTNANPIKVNGHIVWDGNDSPNSVNTAGLGSRNIAPAGENAIQVDVADIATTLGVNLALTLYSNSGANFKTVSLTTTATGPLYFPLTSFTGVTSSSISAISLDITGDNNYLITIGAVESATMPVSGGSVPEPATLALASAGLLGFRCARRRAAR